MKLTCALAVIKFAKSVECPIPLVPCRLVSIVALNKAAASRRDLVNTAVNDLIRGIRNSMMVLGEATAKTG